MKKYIFSLVLINLLSACGFIHTPFDSPVPKKNTAENAPAPEAAKVDTATTPEVSADAIDKSAPPETAASADAPKAEATTDAMPQVAEVARQTEAPAPVAAPVAAPVVTPVAAPVVAVAAPVAADPLNDPANVLSKRSVHFPFDVDAIQSADKPTVASHGSYLAGHLERKIRVTGNTDERGSSEYNLALGQRRANNTKKALVLSGAKATQIEAISLGEEKPLATGHDEASWAQNRRVDIIYK